MIEEMKQWLEAFTLMVAAEWTPAFTRKEYDSDEPEENEMRDRVLTAITSLRQAISEAEKQEPVAFKQFLSDVHTAAGLVTNGKQCKALGERLSEGVMRYMTAPQPQQAEKQEPPKFPIMLRKMWSGTEVQDWINENWNKP